MEFSTEIYLTFLYNNEKPVHMTQQKWGKLLDSLFVSVQNIDQHNKLGSRISSVVFSHNLLEAHLKLDQFKQDKQDQLKQDQLKQDPFKQDQGDRKQLVGINRLRREPGWLDYLADYAGSIQIPRKVKAPSIEELMQTKQTKQTKPSHFTPLGAKAGETNPTGLAQKPAPNGAPTGLLISQKADTFGSANQPLADLPLPLADLPFSLPLMEQNQSANVVSSENLRAFNIVRTITWSSTDLKDFKDYKSTKNTKKITEDYLIKIISEFDSVFMPDILNTIEEANYTILNGKANPEMLKDFYCIICTQINSSLLINDGVSKNRLTSIIMEVAPQYLNYTTKVDN